MGIKSGLEPCPTPIRRRWSATTTIAISFLMTIAAQPAIAWSDETASRSHVLPHIADGDGWQSFLLVTNVSESVNPCTFELYGLGADRFQDAKGVTMVGSTATFELAATGGHLEWRTRNESAVASGYATLDCVHPAVAQVMFASISSSGEPTGMATVFSSQAGTVFQFPVLTQEATLGMAIANDTYSMASCDVVLEDAGRHASGSERCPAEGAERTEWGSGPEARSPLLINPQEVEPTA